MVKLKKWVLVLLLIITYVIYQLYLFEKTENLGSYLIIILGYEFIKYLINTIEKKQIKKELIKEKCYYSFDKSTN